MPTFTCKSCGKKPATGRGYMSHMKIGLYKPDVLMASRIISTVESICKKHGIEVASAIQNSYKILDKNDKLENEPNYQQIILYFKNRAYFTDWIAGKPSDGVCSRARETNSAPSVFKADIVKKISDYTDDFRLDICGSTEYKSNYMGYGETFASYHKPGGKTNWKHGLY